MTMKDDSDSHFVYLYRDLKGKPRYVGYGRTPARATDHLTRTHNKELARFLEKNEFTLEIAGPFHSRESGLSVETALMSVLHPDINIAEGHERWRFRALGIPESYSERSTKVPLKRNDFLESADSILFVLLNSRDFDDQRVGYDPTNPPSDSAILKRMEAWWQLERYRDAWIRKPSCSPSVLVGVYGKPGAQMIIGAVRVQQNGWESAEHDGSQLKVPTCGPSNLDAFKWRGRRIDKAAGIKFGSFRNQIYLILERGRLIGGHPSLYK
ncbi:MAG: hypothetical protein K2X81_01485 [Candidatus Obscuribacterales bacterium]|nr:hypothetical protein [Candidatus Obscuribacterales bacterium]